MKIFVDVPSMISCIYWKYDLSWYRQLVVICGYWDHCVYGSHHGFVKRLVKCTTWSIHYNTGVIEHSSDSANGRYDDSGGSTKRPYESENLCIIHMEGVIGSDEYPNRPTRASDNRKNLTTIGGGLYGSSSQVLKKNKSPYVSHENMWRVLIRMWRVRLVLAAEEE